MRHTAWRVRARSTHLCSRRHHSKCTEGVIKQPLIDVFVQRPYEEIRAHVKLLLIRRGLHSAETMEFERNPRMGGNLLRTLLTLIGFPHNFI